MAVDISRDREARDIWVVLLASPVTWFAHFMLVYLVAEAGCTGGGPGLEVFDDPVPTAVTLGATALAGLACLGFARLGYRRWRTGARRAEAGDAGGLSGHVNDSEGRASLAFVGFLLSLLFFVGILFVGIPAPFVPAC